MEHDSNSQPALNQYMETLANQIAELDAKLSNFDVGALQLQNHVTALQSENLELAQELAVLKQGQKDQSAKFSTTMKEFDNKLSLEFTRIGEEEN